MHTRDILNVCLQTYRNNRICSKVEYVLRKTQTSWANNSGILRIKKEKLSGKLFLYKPEQIVKFFNLH